jgi:hypothetical protein
MSCVQTWCLLPGVHEPIQQLAFGTFYRIFEHRFALEWCKRNKSFFLGVSSIVQSAVCELVLDERLTRHQQTSLINLLLAVLRCNAKVLQRVSGNVPEDIVCRHSDSLQLVRLSRIATIRVLIFLFSYSLSFFRFLLVYLGF